MSIMIAIPCMGTTPVQFTESLLNLEKPEGTKVCFKSSSLIYDARNLLSLTAIEPVAGDVCAALIVTDFPAVATE